MRRFSFKYLYLVMAVIGGITLAWITHESEEPFESETGELPPLKNGAIETPLTTHATSPIFKGMDRKGQPYTVQATSAERHPDDERIHLTKPQYDAKNQDHKTLHVHGDYGVLDEANHLLTLTGHVIIHYGNDTELHVPHMVLNTQTGDIAGHHKDESPVQGDHPKLKLESGHVDVYDHGNVIVMTEHPKLIFKMD